jgi:hypothetical protein
LSTPSRCLRSRVRIGMELSSCGQSAPIRGDATREPPKIRKSSVRIRRHPGVTSNGWQDRRLGRYEILESGEVLPRARYRPETRSRAEYFR